MIGSPGHNNTLHYIFDHLLRKGDFYDIELQPYSSFLPIFSDGALNVSGKSIPTKPMSNTKNGSFTGLPLVLVKKDGCTSVCDTETTS